MTESSFKNQDLPPDGTQPPIPDNPQAPEDLGLLPKRLSKLTVAWVWGLVKSFFAGYPASHKAMLSITGGK
jgi:hypothetical protein